MNEATQVRLPYGRKIRLSFWGILLLTFATCIGTQALTSGDYSYDPIDIDTCAITAYSGSGGNVTIPSSLDGYTVTSIENSCFKSDTNLTAITIPDSVEMLEYSCFQNCTDLASVTLGNGISSIESQTFRGCEALTDMIIPDSVSLIGSSAFHSCIGLTRISLPASITSLSNYAFSSCPSLVGVYCRGDAPADGSYLFSNSEAVIVYRLPGASGWDTTYAERPVVVWNPTIGSIGMQAGVFSFNIDGAADEMVVVEACTNLVEGSWAPVAIANLADGSWQFEDPESSSLEACYYRIDMP